LGGHVNLEPPLRLGDTLGGHLVSGHVDATSSVLSIEHQGKSVVYTFELARKNRYYVVPVGSIAIDGVSLTIAGIGDESFSIAAIPHTLEKTIISRYQTGTVVNLEFDMIGKYVERVLSKGIGHPDGEINAEQLRKWGYEP
jgi:riboflavin synthase